MSVTVLQWQCHSDSVTLSDSVSDSVSVIDSISKSVRQLVGSHAHTMALKIDNDWPIAIVIGIVIDIVDMSLSTCRCRDVIIICL